MIPCDLPVWRLKPLDQCSTAKTDDILSESHPDSVIENCFPHTTYVFVSNAFATYILFPVTIIENSNAVRASM